MPHWSKKYIKAIRKNQQLQGDKTIRELFHELYEVQYLMIDEVKLGSGVVDILGLNTKHQTVTLVEIKSSRDELTRLPCQIRNMLNFGNYSILIVALSHKIEALKIVNRAEFRDIGFAVYRLGSEGAYFEWVRLPVYRDVRGAEVKITRHSKLYEFKELLGAIWGAE